MKELIEDMLYSKDMAFWYDKLYAGSEDIGSELNFLRKIFKKYKIKKILDVGCGTGRHTIELKKLGYSVEGIDLSKPLIEYAREKAKKQRLKMNFYVRDMRNFNLDRKYDAVIILFSTFLYMASNKDAISALQQVNKHLKRGGIVLIDVFYGYNRLVRGFKKRIVNTVKKDNLKLVVEEINDLDEFNNLFYNTVKYKRYIDGKELPVIKTKKLPLRIICPNDLELLLKCTGFKVVKFFGEYNFKKLSETNKKRLIVLAKKI